MAKKKDYKPETLFAIRDKIIKKCKYDIKYDSTKEDILEDVKRYMNLWGDEERVIEYILRHNFYKTYLSFDFALVDVFDCNHPTEYKLYHDFHRHWGKTLDRLVKEAIELYPDEFDFDKAFYYVDEKLQEETRKEFEELKKRNKGQ